MRIISESIASVCLHYRDVYKRQSEDNTMRKSDFTLPTLDDLCSTQAERDDAKLERVRNIPLAELHPFKGHPFKAVSYTHLGLGLYRRIGKPIDYNGI